MALAPGTRLGPYEIHSQIGAGGMGEVYRATDTNLKRSVAIKVLPEELAQDAGRLARLHREGEVLASLNHPNVAQIYGLEKDGAVTALVMEIVEGPTLANRLMAGALPLEEALSIAKQIADALEAAHEHGVVHRDLKPSNVAVRTDGSVKVLDFGLARVMAPVDRPMSAVDSHMLTMTDQTRPGVILGTPLYMSPQQAVGAPVDKRVDIWAFGCVLYEVLTGKPAFGGQTLSEILAGVLERNPDWSALPTKTPTTVRRLLRRCLEKDPRHRLRDIGDARIEIEQALRNDDDGAHAAPAGRPRALWATLVVAIVALTWFATNRASSPAPAPENRLDITTVPTEDPLSFALSPDGRQLVYVAPSDGQPHLWVRSLDTVTPRLLAGTTGAHDPFWSPDSLSVAFFADPNLKRIDLESGLVKTLAEAPFGRGGAWSDRGFVLFVPNVTGPVFRVSADGGTTTAVTDLGGIHGSHRFPWVLPDGRRFVFHAQGASDVSGIYLGSLDSSETKRLTPAGSSGVYAPPGWLLYSDQGTLVARAFDLERGTLTGEPVRVAEHVGDLQSSYRWGFSISRAGLIAYRPTAGPGAAQTRLTWVDRSGTMLGVAGEPDRYAQYEPRISPNGREIAISRRAQPVADLWLLEGTRATKFTFDEDSGMAVWSPDGKRLVYAARKAGSLDVYLRDRNSDKAEVLLDAAENEVPTSWSRVGPFVLYNRADKETGMDIRVLPMEGDRTPTVYLSSQFQEHGGQFSPDGRWVSYQSNESGRYEIYIRSFPNAARRTPVSTNGGISARWSHDGSEIFYVAPDGTLMAVPVARKDDTVVVGSPVALFRAAIVGGGLARVGIDFEYRRSTRRTVSCQHRHRANCADHDPPELEGSSASAPVAAVSTPGLDISTGYFLPRSAAKRRCRQRSCAVLLGGVRGSFA